MKIRDIIAKSLKKGYDVADDRDGPFRLIMSMKKIILGSFTDE
jgi:hypothetical protein